MWEIGLKTAEKTVEVTTQRGIKTLDNPMLNRMFRTNDRNLRYRCLGVDMYTDTLFAGTKSKRGNNTAQVFGTSFGWSRAYGMRSKGDAHEAFSIGTIVPAGTGNLPAPAKENPPATFQTRNPGV
eukprot:scaffold8551_cov59-Attheya_sp.AAC.3